MEVGVIVGNKHTRRGWPQRKVKIPPRILSAIHWQPFSFVGVALPSSSHVLPFFVKPHKPKPHNSNTTPTTFHKAPEQQTNALECVVVDSLADINPTSNSSALVDHVVLHKLTQPVPPLQSVLARALSVIPTASRMGSTLRAQLAAVLQSMIVVCDGDRIKLAVEGAGDQPVEFELKILSPASVLWGFATSSTVAVVANSCDDLQQSVCLDLFDQSCVATVQQCLRLALLTPLEFRLHPVTAFAAPTTLLLHGPSGCGKSTLVKQVAQDLGVNLLAVTALEVFANGAVHCNIQTLQNDARALSPCVLLLDDIEAVVMGSDGENTDKQMASMVHTLVSKQQKGERLCVVATTCQDPALLSPNLAGEFPRAVAVQLPTPQQIPKIVAQILSPAQISNCEDLLGEADRVLYGLGGSDVVAVCSRAVQSCEREGSKLDVAALLRSRKKYLPPSLMQAVGGGTLEVPRVRWEDVGGLHKVKQQLQEAVVWPLCRREGLNRLGITPPGGVLLYGPPGTGKTLLAKAIATESQFQFIGVSVADVMRGEIGETEKEIKRMFALARLHGPCVVFFDEIQAVFSSRSEASVEHNKVVSQLLYELDRCHETNRAHTSDTQKATSHVAVVASTNIPESLDSALLRPGRFDRVVYVPPPDLDARRDILRGMFAHLEFRPTENPDDVVQWLCDQGNTSNFTGADLANLCSLAASSAIRRGLAGEQSAHVGVCMADFERALQKCHPHVTEAMILRYESFRFV